MKTARLQAPSLAVRGRPRLRLLMAPRDPTARYLLCPLFFGSETQDTKYGPLGPRRGRGRVG